MADQYPVTAAGIGGRNTPVWAAGIPHPAVTLVNQGTATIYLDPTSTAGVLGQPLSAGSTLQWDANLALYAVTDIGKTSTLTVSANTGTGFDAGATAAQLISQGLPQAIASAIYVTGVPPVDKPNKILEGTWTQANNGSDPVRVLGPGDCSAFPAVFVYFADTPNSYTGGNTRRFTAQWLDPTGIYPIDTRSYDLPLANGRVFGILRTRGSLLNLSFPSLASGGLSTLYALVVGSYRTPQKDTIWLQNQISAATLGLTQLAGRTAPAGATWWNYLGGGAEPIGGYVDFPGNYLAGDYFIYGAANQACFLQLIDAVTNLELYKLNIAANVAANGNFHIPPGALKLNLQIGVANTTYSLTFMRQGLED